MPSGRMHTVVKRLRQSALFDAGVSDGDLLERYLAQRDEAAFAALVRRHGPMVLGVCRRILRNPHDADDAFQATFLVLVRKAHAVIPRERVGPWLYGVAYRTSLKAKAMSSRRRAKQKSLHDVPGPPPPADTDWVALLDQEVQRLPEKYRLAVVLCDLEGKTRKQTARQLGWPEGTVATRLQHGRSLVQKRLARFGLPISAGAMTLVWAEATAAAALPAPLVASTVQTAAVFAAGKIAGLIPLKVIALAQGVLNAMVISKIKNATAMLIVLGALGLTVGLSGGLRPVVADEPGAQQPTEGQLVPPQIDRTPAATAPSTRSEGRLPIGTPPVQALVRLDHGKLVVCTNQGPYYQPRQMVDGNGRPSTVYEVVHALRTEYYLPSQVEVFDTRRRKLDNKDMPKWLKEEIPALVQFGVRDIDPLHLRLIKDGTLIFILPGQVAPPTTTYVVPPPLPAPAGAPNAPERQAASGALPPPPVPYYANPQVPPVTVPAYPPSSEVVPAKNDIVVNERNFSIPIRVDEKRHADLREIILYVSKNQGETWERVAAVPATQTSFTFEAPADGSYWFCVAAAQRGNKDQPPSIVKGPAQLKVVVDTVTPRTSATPPIDGRIDQAERELATAEFYLKAGQRGSATFYYELIRRRYAGTSYANRATKLLQDLQAQEKTQAPPQKAAARIGEIIIVGNKRVPDSVILSNLPLYPGQILNYTDVRAAEDKRRGMKEFVNASPIVNIRPTVTVIESKGDGQFKDILVTVHESLRLDVLAEMERLAGTWIVTSATIGGKESSIHSREMVIEGDSITMNPKNSESRCTYTLELTAKPKRMRITPVQNPNGLPPTEARYELSGNTMEFSAYPRSDEPSTAGDRNVMVLKLTRKAPATTNRIAGIQIDMAGDLIKIRSKNVTISAMAIAFEPNGRLKLTKGSVVYAPDGPGSAPTGVQAEEIYLKLDAPVSRISELAERRIVSIESRGTTVLLTD